ncbi:MAG: transketolase [Clostridia bacterium]|nr:transketolase [Clostridia bacterium]
MEDLKNIANNIRKDIIHMIYSAGSGHPGGSLSCVEILVALYHHIMDLSDNDDGMRKDKFILSKGHAAPAYYAILASKEYIKKEDLVTLRKYDSYLEGHPSNKINGVDVSSGSLGQGMSIANGMALEKRLSHKEGMVYCLLGDGEMEEGQVWEAFMTSNKYNLSNVVAIIDSNGLQIDGTVDTVKKLNHLSNKIESFGFNTVTVNGHDFDELIEALENAKKSQKPNCIIAKTIKGKGVSFMENEVKWHGKGLSEDEYKKAMQELGGM